MHYDKPTEGLVASEAIPGQPGKTRNLTQLTALIKTRLRRMQYRPGLDLTPFCNSRN